jgi:hypothetical protein
MDVNDLYPEPLASQYPDNVVEKFAKAFTRQHAYDGPGSCLVSYSRELTVVNCWSDLSFSQPLVALIVLAILVQLIWFMVKMIFCCRK